MLGEGGGFWRGDANPTTMATSPGRRKLILCCMKTLAILPHPTPLLFSARLRHDGVSVGLSTVRAWLRMCVCACACLAACECVCHCDTHLIFLCFLPYSH